MVEGSVSGSGPARGGEHLTQAVDRHGEHDRVADRLDESDRDLDHPGVEHRPRRAQNSPLSGLTSGWSRWIGFQGTSSEKRNALYPKSRSRPMTLVKTWCVALCALFQLFAVPTMSYS
jgi:hypothetical protein